MIEIRRVGYLTDCTVCEATQRNKSQKECRETLLVILWVGRSIGRSCGHSGDRQSKEKEILTKTRLLRNTFDKESLALSFTQKCEHNV